MLAWTFTERSLTHSGGLRSARIALGCQARGLGVIGFLEEDGELVAAETGSGVTRPQRTHQPSGHRHQELVAGAVPKTVIDQLEIVEVQEQDSQRRQGPSSASQGMFEAVPEQGPVGQPGERIVEGLVLERLLERLALRHVAKRQHDTFDGGLPSRLLATTSVCRQDPSTYGYATLP